MPKPFMIRFAFKGRGCYANVYLHNGSLQEYHVHLIDPSLHPELPSKIILTQVEGRLHLSEPLNLPKTVLALVVEEIEKREA